MYISFKTSEIFIFAVIVAWIRKAVILNALLLLAHKAS